jgi:hypothetical protein
MARKDHRHGIGVDQLDYGGRYFSWGPSVQAFCTPGPSVGSTRAVKICGGPNGAPRSLHKRVVRRGVPHPGRAASSLRFGSASMRCGTSSIYLEGPSHRPARPGPARRSGRRPARPPRRGAPASRVAGGGVSYWRLGRPPSRLVPLPAVAAPGDLLHLHLAFLLIL